MNYWHHWSNRLFKWELNKSDRSNPVLKTRKSSGGSKKKRSPRSHKAAGVYLTRGVGDVFRFRFGAGGGKPQPIPLFLWIDERDRESRFARSTGVDVSFLAATSSSGAPAKCRVITSRITLVYARAGQLSFQAEPDGSRLTESERDREKRVGWNPERGKRII